MFIWSCIAFVAVVVVVVLADDDDDDNDVNDDNSVAVAIDKFSLGILSSWRGSWSQIP